MLGIRRMGVLRDATRAAVGLGLDRLEPRGERGAAGKRLGRTAIARREEVGHIHLTPRRSVPCSRRRSQFIGLTFLQGGAGRGGRVGGIRKASGLIHGGVVVRGTTARSMVRGAAGKTRHVPRGTSVGKVRKTPAYGRIRALERALREEEEVV